MSIVQTAQQEGTAIECYSKLVRLILFSNVKLYLNISFFGFNRLKTADSHTFALSSYYNDGARFMIKVRN